MSVQKLVLIFKTLFQNKTNIINISPCKSLIYEDFYVWYTFCLLHTSPNGDLFNLKKEFYMDIYNLSSKLLTDEILDALFGDYTEKQSKVVYGIIPTGNVYCKRNNDEMIYNVNLAGTKKEDINITYDKNKITIDVRKKSTDNIKDKVLFLKEFTVPDEYDIDTIDVKYEDGLLNINIKKRINKSRTKINIK